MAKVVFKATTYYIRFLQSGDIHYNGVTLKIHAIVVLRGSYDNQQYELAVFFMKKGSDPLDAKYSPEYRKGNIYLPFEEMSTFMNLLHNDSMIKISFDSANTSQIEISSDERPIQ